MNKIQDPKPLNFYIETGVKTTMNAWTDPLFLKGVEMFQNGEMNRWQFTKFCERHKFLMF